jgi:hypothetical protein
MQRRNHSVKRPSQIGVAALLAAALFGAAIARAADDKPEMSPGTETAPHDPQVFRADPSYTAKEYEAGQQIDIYGGKSNINEPRPIIEMGQPLYLEGPLAGGYNVIGRKNLVTPGFSVFGDWRNAVAYNNNGPKKEVGQAATRLNLETDLALTATERIHALFRPLDQNGQFTRSEFFGPDRKGNTGILNGNVRTLFFEGDAGNILAGLTDKYQSFDLPFSAGLMPLIFQNGVWVNSAITGAAVAIPGRNSSTFGISNMDLTFFAGFDKVTTPALKNAQNNFVEHGVRVYGAAAFIEANQGYWEAGFGHIDDREGFGSGDYNSATLAFTKRYGGWLSNSLRGVWSFGQAPLANKQQTADGFIMLMENSLVSAQELTLVPYLNLFAGFDRPQSLLRNADAGGILFNTGITFQTDGLTGFPKLDDTGQDTYGGALGLEYLFNLDQQIVVEASTVQVRNGNFEPGRPAKADQYGVGARYQIPLSNSLIFRSDVIYAWRQQDDNVAGVRTEIRVKF